MRHLDHYKSLFSSKEKLRAYRFHTNPLEDLEGLSSAVKALSDAERAKGTKRTSVPLKLAKR